MSPFEKYFHLKTLGALIGDIVRDLFTNKIDIYHGLSHELPIGIEKTNIKTVVTIHDLIFIRYPHLFRTIDRKIYYTKFKSACQRADKIIAISQQTKQDIIDFFYIPKERIEVVYQGCNSIFHHPISDNTKQAVQERYNIPKDYLLTQIVTQETRNLKNLIIATIPIVFVGRPTKYKELLLDEISKNDQLKNQVIFIENASNGELKELYQLAQLSVYPSIFEGFGIPVLESIAAGTPVITNKAGCFKEAGGEAAFYIDPNNSEEFGSAIKLLTENTEALNRLKLAATHHLENFKEAELAAQLMSIYKGA